jgi:hypothetical protein
MARAINGPLTPAKSGLSRSLGETSSRRSSTSERRIVQIPKLTVRVRPRATLRATRTNDLTVIRTPPAQQARTDPEITDRFERVRMSSQGSTDLRLRVLISCLARAARRLVGEGEVVSGGPGVGVVRA